MPIQSPLNSILLQLKLVCQQSISVVLVTSVHNIFEDYRPIWFPYQPILNITDLLFQVRAGDTGDIWDNVTQSGEHQANTRLTRHFGTLYIHTQVSVRDPGSRAPVISNQSKHKTQPGVKKWIGLRTKSFQCLSARSKRLGINWVDWIVL